MTTDTELTRRLFLQLLGVGVPGAALTAAGCSRATEDDDNEFRTAAYFDVPPKASFNFLGGVANQINMIYINDLIMMPGAMYMWEPQTYFHLLADPASKMSSDGKTFTYVVRDDLTWSDGEPITARDVYTTWLLRWANNHAVFAFVDRFELVDDKTVVFHIPKPSPITEYYLLRERIVADSVYGQWAPQVERALEQGKQYDDDVVVKMVDEINRYRPKTAVVSGPLDFDYDAVSNSELMLVKNDNGYRADAFPFNRVRVHRGDVQSMTPLILAKSVDYAIGAFPVATEKEFVKLGYRISRPPFFSGPALYISYSSLAAFKDKRVRQALAHAIDRRQSGRVSLGESGRDVELMVGMPDFLAQTWMSQQDLERVTRYDHNPEQAERLLHDAGWRKRGNTWHTPEGDEAAYDLLYPSDFADWTAAAHDLQAQLSNFGFKVTNLGRESTQVSELIDAGDFEFAINAWGAATSPFPTIAYRASLYDHNIPGLRTSNQPGIGFEPQQHTDSVGPIDFEQALVDAGRGEDQDALAASVGRLALAFNELLPVLPLFERYGNAPINTETISGWPGANDPIWRNSQNADNFTTILLYKGDLTPT